MKYRNLPGTGISVSNLAFGAMGFGTETEPDEAFAILDAFDDTVGDAGRVPTLETRVVVGRHASEQCHFFATQPGNAAPCAAIVGEPCPLGRDSVAAGGEELLQSATSVAPHL